MVILSLHFSIKELIISLPSIAVFFVPEVRILLTPRLYSVSTKSKGFLVSSIALWKTIFKGFATSHNIFIFSISNVLSSFKTPNTTDSTPSCLQTLMSSIITSISSLVYVKFPPRGLIIQAIGIFSISIHFLIVPYDGVVPPSSKLSQSSILFAPFFCASRASFIEPIQASLIMSSSYYIN